MFETIILATCLVASPLTCKDVEIYVTPEHGASLQLPYQCAHQGQIEIQKWLSEHPAWRVQKWSCPPYGKVGQKT